jgi:integrase
VPVYRRQGVWYADVQHKGRRLKQSAGKGRDRSDAKALEAELLARLTNQARSIYYLDDAIAKWLDEHASRLKSYKKFAEHAKQLTPFVHNRLLSEAPDVAREYVNGSAHLKPATINQRLRILRRVANVAFAEWRWLATPEGLRIKTLPENNRRSSYLLPDEIERICAAVYSPGVADAVNFAAYSGVRLGELMRLDAASVRDGVLYLDSLTKSGRQRTIPLPARIQGINLPIRATRNQIQDQFRTATRNLGMTGVRFHDLRHTYASLLLQRGARLSHVQELLGHSTIAITKDLYGHLEADHLEAAVKLLDE